MAKQKNITLALQGGGTHGAFTWGVLDRLLEETNLRITGISGTSAGAMNAAVLADGFEKGGTDLAKGKLHNFWKAMSRLGSFSPYQSPLFNPTWDGWSPMSALFDTVSRFASPYQFNPFNINPLQKVLEDTIDYDCLRNCHSIKLFISATNVRTNRLRIFTSREISPQVLLASACLPELHHAIEINGDAYWDGGFMGNPTLEPLLHNCDSSDVIIVQLNPTQRESIPQTARDIAERQREITLNASLMREIRNIVYINRAAEQDDTDTPRWANINLHQISAQDVTRDLSAASKFDTSWPFLTSLKDHGRNHAEAWLTKNKRHISKKTTLPLHEWEDYLDY
ncbi:MAG: patatin-like phospholipase family protein [Gammaproteobacteria bacterium]|nr:patatin-like phospholipase family protein [Gammaproteobacteria bacterium]